MPTLAHIKRLIANNSHKAKNALEMQHVLTPEEIQAWPDKLAMIQQEQTIALEQKARTCVHLKSFKHDGNHYRKRQEYAQKHAMAASFYRSKDAALQANRPRITEEEDNDRSNSPCVIS